MEENDKKYLDNMYLPYETPDVTGSYKIKGTAELKLKDYQLSAYKNIDKIFEKKKFAAAVLPTGSGKSFIALAQMLKRYDSEILYIAPDEDILEQIKDDILEYIMGKEDVTNKDELIKEVFPHLKLCTYHTLVKSNESESIINHNYDFVIFDELHRTGAPKWSKKVERLVRNQDLDCKFLGLTATPERNVDFVNMADFWALYFGYTEEEVDMHKHYAINMDIYTAEDLGYLITPLTICPEYDEPILNELKEQMENISDKRTKKALIKRLNTLRKKIINAAGADKIYKKYLKKGGRYIVYLPAFNKSEELDGNKPVTIKGKDVIEKYKKELLRYYKENEVEFYSMLGEYGSKINKKNLHDFENSKSDKIKFILVINKLCEGKHSKRANGAIDYRALDENSNILFWQRRGRITRALSPGESIEDYERPIYIDFPLNTLKINKNTRKIEDNKDLDMIAIIISWCKSHNGKIPDINSEDKIEATHATKLKNIKLKYFKYYENPKLLNSLRSKEKNKIIEIINFGNNIGIWNYEFPLVNKKEKKINDMIKEKTNIEDFSLIEEKEELSSLIKDTKLASKSSLIEERLAEIYNICNGNIFNFPKTYYPKSLKDGDDVRKWVNTNKKSILKLVKENRNALFAAVARDWLSPEIEKDKVRLIPKLKEVYDTFSDMPENIPSYSCSEKLKDGTDVYDWIKWNKKKIINLYEYTNLIIDEENFEYTEELEKDFLSKLKEIYEIYNNKEVLDNIPLDVNISFLDWINMNKEMILMLSLTNKCAKFIVESNDWSTFDFDINSAILYSKLKQISDILQYDKINEHCFCDKINFGEVSLEMASWTFQNELLILEINKYARFICKVKGWFPREELEEEAEKKLESKIKELSDKTESNETNLNELSCDANFVDGSARVPQWVERNKNSIIHPANQNEHARFICKSKNWTDNPGKKQTNSKLKIGAFKHTPIDYIFEYIELLNTGYEPRMNENYKKFSNGIPISYFWVYNKENIVKELLGNPIYNSGYDVAKNTITSLCIINVLLNDVSSEFLNSNVVDSNIIIDNGISMKFNKND